MELKPLLTISVRTWYEEWMQQARCKWIDPEAWFPDGGGLPQVVKEICKTQCPVRVECLNYAMKFEEGTYRGMRAGIYGGMSPQERYKYEPQWLRERQGAA